VPIDFNELRQLLGTIAQTDINEFTLKSEGFELTVRKGTVTASAITAAVVSETVATSLPPPVAVTPPPAAETAPEPTTTTIDKKWVPIASPMVGTFYRAPAPNEAPFIEVNDRVSQGQTVCIIEAMKLMNEIEAELSGQVMEIAVANGEPVEYGQTLMWVAPA
jgi:acetyl-CoA carboxylase biotin carboxyl carrier protein